MIKKLLSITLVTAALAGNAQQMANSGFETWSGSPSGPTGWTTLDQAVAASTLSAIGNQGFVTQSTSPYSGTYAVTLTTKAVALLGGATFPAALVYGGMAVVGTSGVAITGTPFTGMPTSATYYIKGTIIATDSIPTIVLLTKWNTVTGKRDTVGGGTDYVKSSFITTSYQARTFPIIAGAVPDSIQYIISSSAKTASPTVGSSVTVDAISLTYAPAGIATNHATQATSVAYPNPAANQITLATTSERAKFTNVYDLTGRLMSKVEMTNKQVNIDLNSFNSGMYIYTITDENNHSISTSKFSVTK